MKLVRIIKMCLSETYSRIRVGKNLSDIFPIRSGLKQGDALSPLLFNLALEYAITRYQVIQDGLKLNGTHQLLVYADDVNMLGRSVRTMKEKAEASLVASKKVGLEIIAGKTTYMVIRQVQNAGRSRNMKTDKSSFERVAELKYVGKILTNKNYIQEEIKCRLKSGNDCYHSVRNLLSSNLLSQNLKIKIYRTIILPVVLYGCETWSLTLREDGRLRVLENMVLRRIFGPKRDEG